MHIEISVPSIVILVGISGAGKSTFANRYFNQTEVLSSDRCRALVADDENDQSATGPAFALLRTLTRMRLRRGRLCVIDATNIKPKDRKKFVKLANELQSPVAAIVLDPGIDVCLARQTRRVDRDISEASIRLQYEIFLRHIAKLESEGFSPVWRVEAVFEPVEIRRRHAGAAIQLIQRSGTGSNPGMPKESPGSCGIE
jgi:protein phosphatase